MRSRLFAGRLFAGRLFGPAERAEYYGGISEDELIARILADWPRGVPITDARVQKLFDTAMARQLAPTEPDPATLAALAARRRPPTPVLPATAERIRAAVESDDEEALVFILANL